MALGEHPVANLTRQLSKHDAFSRGNLSRISVFYAKLFLQEPFRIYEHLKYRKKIREHYLQKDPIFIVGHWRSGTSFLQYLLSQDPQFGYMNKFEVVFPDIFLSSESILKSLVNLIPDSLALIQDAQNMSINLELDSPSEIEIALTTMISPTSLHWGHIFPKNAWEYFNKYLFFDTANNKEIRLWKQHYHYLIKKTSIKNDGRQLLIKSPGNASRMTKLLEMYPDAKFVFIHRNPYDVFYSSKKLWTTLLDNLALQDFGKQAMENEIIRVYKKLMKQYLKQRSMIPELQRAEIQFKDFVSDPVKQLQKTYSSLNISGFKAAELNFRQFLTQKQQGKSSNYEYENRIIKRVNNEWKFAFEEWNYSLINSSELS